MVYDFHTHTLLSDGELLPIELIRRAAVLGHQAVALTDHASASNLEPLISALARDCALAQQHMQIRALPGIELTHVPPPAIAELAARAKALGAAIVIVHGETPVEPVAPGTNLAALNSPEVDLLSHPGLLTPEEAALAAERGIFLELSARKGHCLANGHVAALAREAGALLLVGSDAHSPGDLLDAELARRVALGAGLSEEEARRTLLDNPRALLARLEAR
jgi:histidinol phosphatase-like PHP family hydrolase